MKVDPSLNLNMTDTSVQEHSRIRIAQEDPLILIGVPPCTVFSPMQNINQNIKAQHGSKSINTDVSCYWDQIERSWNQKFMEQLAVRPGVYVVVSDMC